MHSKHKGSHNELIAAAWLLQQGFEVFRNVSAHGEIDLVVFKHLDGMFRPIDVTSLSLYQTSEGEKINIPYQKINNCRELGGRVVFVDAKNKCFWDDDIVAQFGDLDKII